MLETLRLGSCRGPEDELRHGDGFKAVGGVCHRFGGAVTTDEAAATGGPNA